MVDVTIGRSGSAVAEEDSAGQGVELGPDVNPPDRRISRQEHKVTRSAALFGLVAVAVALRVPLIGRAYWIDEGISIGISSHPIGEIPKLLRLDGSPPLFYFMLHFWVQLFGSSPAATHALPLVISVLMVPLAWWCARSLFGEKQAWCAAVLAATNPFLNWYATETRMYSLVCALGLAAVTFAIRASRHRSTADTVLAVVTFAALLYTHNWAIYLAAATAAVMVARAYVKGRPSEAAVVVAAAVTVVLLYLPWLPTLVYQARHTAAPWAVSPSLGDLFSDPAATLGGTLALLVVPALAIAVLVNFGRTLRSGVQPAIAAAAIGLSTLAGGWLMAQIQPSWTSRYLAVTVGVLLVAIAGILGRNRFGLAVVAITALTLVGWSIWGFLLPDDNAAFAKSNVAAIDAQARPWLSPGDLVIVTQTEQVPVVAHYLPPGLKFATPTGRVRDPRVVDWRDLVHRLVTATPCQDLGSPIDRLAVGSHVLIINPFAKVGASGTQWSRTVNGRIAGVNAVVRGDPALMLTAAFGQGVVPKPFSAVTASLFTKITSESACS